MLSKGSSYTQKSVAPQWVAMLIMWQLSKINWDRVSGLETLLYQTREGGKNGEFKRPVICQLKEN